MPVYAFNSNVQPKMVKNPAPEPWYCHACDKDVAAYFKKCPSCHSKRNA